MLHAALAVALSGPPAFTSGLMDLYAYAGRAAAREFERGESADPSFVLNYWGEALALGSNLNIGLSPARFADAHAAIAKATPYLASASPRDRELTEAVAARYAGNYGDYDRNDANYRRLMEAYLKAYPDDDDATMILVEDLMEWHGMHWDADDAAADDVSREILSLTRRVLARDPQHVFANHLCIHEYDNAPDRTPAIPCAERLDAMTFTEPQEHLAHVPAHVWMELGDGKRALYSSGRAWALHPQRYAEHDAYVGLSAAMMCGDSAAVQTWRARLATAEEDPVSLALPFYAVQAQQLERSGKIDAALAVLQNAARAQSPLNELVPLYPADVRVGALLFRAGRFSQARDAFAAILAHHPRLPRALFGMAESLAKLGDTQGAAQYRARFARYWAGGTLSMNDF